MAVLKTETLPIATEMDVVQARQAARSWAVELGFKLVDQTKIVTAASELARNTLIYGGGGSLTLRALREDPRMGLELVFEDQGPGIADVAQAMRDGFTSGSGLGMGLGGSKRLMSDFKLETEPGKGTRVTVVRWR